MLRSHAGSRANDSQPGELNVVGECLDELIVRPGMDEIDEQPAPRWWDRWRPRPE